MALTLPGDGEDIATVIDPAGDHVQTIGLARSDDPDSLITADADGMLVNLGGNNDISGSVSVSALPADPLGANADAAATGAGSINAHLRQIAGAGVNVLSTVPGTGATSLGKAVDSPAGGTDTGAALLAVRDDALTTLTPADGDYAQTRVDSKGRIWTRMSMVDPATGEEQTFARPAPIVVTPTVDTSAYADGDNLSSAIINFAGATQVSAGTGWISSLFIIDDAGNIGGSATPNVGLELWFPNASLTPPSANAAFNLSDPDAAKTRCVISTVNGIAYSFGGGTFTQIEPGRPIPYSLATGTTLPCVVKVLDPDADGPVWAADDIHIGIHTLQD